MNIPKMMHLLIYRYLIHEYICTLFLDYLDFTVINCPFISLTYDHGERYFLRKIKKEISQKEEMDLMQKLFRKKTKGYWKVLRRKTCQDLIKKYQTHTKGFISIQTCPRM